MFPDISLVSQKIGFFTLWGQLGPTKCPGRGKNGPKWPFLTILAIFGVPNVRDPPKSIRMRSRNTRGYPLRRYHTTMGPGETFWETPGPIQGLRTGFPIGRPILASKIGLFKVIFGSFWAILCHIWSFLAVFGRIWVEYHLIQHFVTKNRSKRHFLGYF